MFSLLWLELRLRFKIPGSEVLCLLLDPSLFKEQGKAMLEEIPPCEFGGCHELPANRVMGRKGVRFKMLTAVWEEPAACRGDRHHSFSLSYLELSHSSFVLTNSVVK